MNPNNLPGILTAAGILVNVAWSALNLKMMNTLRKTMRDEFCPRDVCAKNHEIVSLQHSEICRRLDEMKSSKGLRDATA